MKLSKYRKALRISQIRLARLAHVSRFRLALFEIGDGDLLPEEIDRLNGALRAEADRLSGIANDLDSGDTMRASLEVR